MVSNTASPSVSRTAEGPAAGLRIPQFLSREGMHVTVLDVSDPTFVQHGVRRRLLLGLEHVNRLLEVGLDMDRFVALIAEVSADNTMADYVSVSLMEETTHEWYIKAEQGALDPVCKRICHQIMTCDCVQLFENNATYLPCVDRLVVDSVSVALMCVPLLLDGRVVGGITLVRTGRESRFSSADASLAAILGQWASLKVANIGLLNDLATRRSHEQKLLTEICRSQEDERRRVAAELHDGVAQWMVSAAYDISTCQWLLGCGNSANLEESLERVKGTLQTCIKELRRAISNLRPLPIAELGLIGALNQSVHAMKGEGMEVAVNVWGDLPDLSLAEENTIYWIVQEALNNVRKHAQAKTVTLELQSDGGMFSIRIVDDGAGFDVESAGRSPGSLYRMGLVGMRERADLLGGTLHVSSRPGVGTEVVLSFQLMSRLMSAQGGQ